MVNPLWIDKSIEHIMDSVTNKILTKGDNYAGLL